MTTFSMNRSKLRNGYLILMLLVIIGLQFYAAYQKSYWGDETFTVSTVRGGLSGIGKNLPAHQQPLFYYLMAAWGRVLGYSEVGLRSLAIVFAVSTAVFAYLLGRDLFGEWAGLASVTILGLSPLFILHAHDARYYSMMSASAVLAVLASYRYWKMGKLWYLLPYALASVFMLYLLFISAGFIAGVNAWWFFRYLRERKRNFSDLLLWIMAQVLIVALYLPAMGQFSTFTRSYLEVPGLPNLATEFIKRLAYTSYVFSLGGTLSPLNPIAWIGIEAVAICAIYAMVALRKEADFWLLVFLTVWNSLLAVMETFFSEGHNLTWQNLSHWFFYILPFIAIWLGAGLARMKPKLSALLSCLLLVAYGAGLFNYFSGRQFLQPVYTIPWRTIFASIQQEAKPDSMLICTSLESSCWYYANQYGFQVSLPWDLENKSAGRVPEVWWVHTNVGGDLYERQDIDQKFLGVASSRYSKTDVTHYVEHDPSIRWIKSRFMGKADYDYLVVVYHFYNP
jgi:hypothetical protein